MSNARSATVPDYGIDAPGVVRNLLLGGAGGLVLYLLAVVGVVPRDGVTFHIGEAVIGLPLGTMGLSAGLPMLAMGLWMLWSSKFGKVRERERLLDHLTWTGSEQVLDVGCGRGLLLIGAAKRLVRGGKAIGVDIWQAEDLTGNSAAATLGNARLEGVAERIETRTADMRTLPFADETFDTVVSLAAIHNLYAVADRRRAIAEIARVLKRGGTALIADIRHGAEYAAAFAASGCPQVETRGSKLGSLGWALVTLGSLRPHTLLVQKAR